jgi:hypothetical protein
MPDLLRLATEIFDGEISPLLTEWGFSVSAETRDAPVVWWEIGWKELTYSITAEHLNGDDSLVLRGGYYMTTMTMVDEEIGDKAALQREILSKFKYLLEPAITYLTEQEVKRLFGKMVWFFGTRRNEQTRNLLSWGVGRFYASCRLSLMLRRRRWRWHCNLCQAVQGKVNFLSEHYITPADGTPNPAEALLQFVGKMVAAVIL